MEPEDDRPKHEPDDMPPRKSLWSTMPKRTVVRVLILLAALFGIVYLRKQTGSIADCMSTAFRAPPPPSTKTPEFGVRARIQPPVDATATR
jgi:hypothetical protein